jgi:ribosomal protein S18 acetylase RimI-like enzyme
LVAAFVAAASASGNARCVLEVEVTNAAALALYGRHGFVEIDRRRADDPTSGASLEYLHLARRLAP